MKRSKIIKKLSLTYWQVYTEQLRLAEYAEKLREQGHKKTSRHMAKRAREAGFTLEGVMLSAAALGIGLEELQATKKYIVEWTDHEGNLHDKMFDSLTEAQLEAASLKEKYDFVTIDGEEDQA